jgi:hypothetical protein
VALTVTESAKDVVVEREVWEPVQRKPVKFDIGRTHDRENVRDPGILRPQISGTGPRRLGLIPCQVYVYV